MLARIAPMASGVVWLRRMGAAVAMGWERERRRILDILICDFFCLFRGEQMVQIISNMWCLRERMGDMRNVKTV